MTAKKGSTSGSAEIVDEDIARRLLAKIVVVDGCHIYGRSHGTRYGTISVNNVNRLAHRVSYTLHKGPIPPGAVIMHSCDNRRCVNPEHLTIGTQSENIRDAFAKGRMKPRGKEMKARDI